MQRVAEFLLATGLRHGKSEKREEAKTLTKTSKNHDSWKVSTSKIQENPDTNPYKAKQKHTFLRFRFIPLFEKCEEAETLIKTSKTVIRAQCSGHIQRM